MTNYDSYGFCPECGEPGYSRERRLGGYTFCIAGHKWKSKEPYKLKRSKEKILREAMIKIEEAAMLYLSDPRQGLVLIEEIAESALETSR